MNTTTTIDINNKTGYLYHFNQESDLIAHYQPMSFRFPCYS